MPESPQTVNVPRERWEQLLAAPLRLAELQAADLFKAGDVAGAVQRLRDGAAQQEAMRARRPPSRRLPRRRRPSRGSARPPNRKPWANGSSRDMQARALDKSQTDPRTDLSRPFGLGPACAGSNPRLQASLDCNRRTQ